MPRPTPSDHAAHIEQHSESIPWSGCQIWMRGVDSSGYGTIKYKGRTCSVHRLKWTLHNGPIPDGLILMHSCDVPCCVALHHLSIATHADNSHDRDRKGRQIAHPGSKNGLAILDEQRVLLIRADNRPNRVIADEQKISLSLVWKVKTRRMWKHVP